VSGKIDEAQSNVNNFLGLSETESWNEAKFDLFRDLIKSNPDLANFAK
jgi:hypothetical protein